jgi:hypothetical protein
VLLTPFPGSRPAFPCQPLRPLTAPWPPPVTWSMLSRILPLPPSMPPRTRHLPTLPISLPPWPPQPATPLHPLRCLRSVLLPQHLPLLRSGLPFLLSRPNMPLHFRGCPSGHRTSEGAHPRHLSLSHQKPRPSPPQSTQTTGNPNPSSGAPTQHPHPTLSCPSLRQRSCRPRNRRLIGILSPALRPQRSQFDSRRRQRNWTAHSR